jgi:hypothetical protein
MGLSLVNDEVFNRHENWVVMASYRSCDLKRSFL